MGYAHGKRWADGEVEESIISMADMTTEQFRIVMTAKEKEIENAMRF